MVKSAKEVGEMKQLRWLPAGILILLWWGVLYPETALTQDAYRVVDAYGNEVELSEEDRERYMNRYCRQSLHK